MKLSFIGLGVMGKGMALNLGKHARDENIEYLVCDANPEVLKEFEKEGIQTTTKIKDTTNSDYVFLCLPNLDIVQNVVLGDDGLLNHMKESQVIIDFSTTSYLGAREIAFKCLEKDVEFLDCPISGQEKKSLSGTLSIMCGGNEKIFNEVKPLLDKMGTQIMYMGEIGSGQLTKMINNCVLNICTASFSELMPVGIKLGLDAEKLSDILMTATGSSFASKTLLPKVLEGDFVHGFSMERAYKDMESMNEVLMKYEIPLPTFSGTMQTYQLALQNGQRDYYKHAMIAFYEDMLGVKARKEGFE